MKKILLAGNAITAEIMVVLKEKGVDLGN